MNLSWMSPIFQPTVSYPDGLDHDLDEIVSVLTVKQDYPVVSEIYLFGSVITRKWNPLKSDIDLAVLLETDDDDFSAFAGLEVCRVINEDGEWCEFFRESTTRDVYRRLVTSNPDVKYKDRYEVHILTPRDVSIMESGIPLPSRMSWLIGDKPLDKFIKTIKSGRKVW